MSPSMPRQRSPNNSVYRPAKALSTTFKAPGGGGGAATKPRAPKIVVQNTAGNGVVKPGNSYHANQKAKKIILLRPKNKGIKKKPKMPGLFMTHVLPCLTLIQFSVKKSRPDEAKGEEKEREGEREKEKEQLLKEEKMVA